MLRTVPPSRVIEPGSPARSDSTWTSGPGGAVRGHHHLDHAAAVVGDGLTTTGPGSAMERPTAWPAPLGQALADVAGLGVAVEHRVDHVVDRAGADGVVGGVADDQASRPGR